MYSSALFDYAIYVVGGAVLYIIPREQMFQHPSKGKFLSCF